MRKLVAFLLTGLALYGAYWFAANRLFDEGSYRKQVAFGSVFVPFGWAYALGFLEPGKPVTVFRSNRWTRLTAPGGHVLLR